MDYDVYMEQPKDFEQGDCKETVYLLKKALYGTRQGGIRWNHKMHTTLESLGFKQTYSNAAVYIFTWGDVQIILPVFVDDMTFASKSLDAIKQVIANLTKHFKLCNLGPTIEILGIKIDHDWQKCSLMIPQHQYCIDMLSHFNMADCKPVTTPIKPGLCLLCDQSPRTAEECNFMHFVDYGGAIGFLQYLSCTTQPDMAFAVGQLTSFTLDPGVAHWNVIKHLFCYIQGLLTFNITYASDSSSS